MTLHEYLRANGIGHKAFGARVGVTAATVSRWAAGLLVPRLAKLHAIKLATGGVVTADDFHAADTTPNVCRPVHNAPVSAQNGVRQDTPAVGASAQPGDAP